MAQAIRRALERLLHRTVPASAVRGFGGALVAVGLGLPWAVVGFSGWEAVEVDHGNEPTPHSDEPGLWVIAPEVVPTIVDEDSDPAPPQDRPKSGYVGPSGISIVQAMSLELEALREDKPEGPVEKVRLGSQQVLPPQTIHIVNLWASWCDPCIKELSDFKAMFARHNEWGDRVNFVPIMLKDPAPPKRAYSDVIMPPARYKLADRGTNDPLAQILASDKQRTLFTGGLPVTFVLDCNRRVRWIHFEQMQVGQFNEIETHVAHFLEEIDDKTPGAWCSQEWPGNGRCEGDENAVKHHSLADCGPIKSAKNTGNTNNAPDLLPAVVPEPCPESTIRSADGRCLPKLRTAPAERAKEDTSSSCGNLVCETEAGESKITCCIDCPCNAPLACKPAQGGGSSCQAGLK